MTQNRLLKKEQNERKKDNEKAVEALNKVQSLLDEKTDEAKRTVETLESERRKTKRYDAIGPKNEGDGR